MQRCVVVRELRAALFAACGIEDAGSKASPQGFMYIKYERTGVAAPVWLEFLSFSPHARCRIPIRIRIGRCKLGVDDHQQQRSSLLDASLGPSLPSSQSQGPQPKEAHAWGGFWVLAALLGGVKGDRGHFGWGCPSAHLAFF